MDVTPTSSFLASCRDDLSHHLVVTYRLTRALKSGRWLIHILAVTPVLVWCQARQWLRKAIVRSYPKHFTFLLSLSLDTLSEELRGNTRLATTMSVESTTLSPLLGDLELDFPPLRLPSPTHAPSSTITQPASQPNRVFIMPDRPTISNFTSYISPNIVPFQSLRIFAEHITEKRTSLAGRDDGSLFVSGSTVLEAAQALILVIKGTGRNQTTLFESELVWGGQGSKLSLSNLFQHSSWIFNA